MFLYGATDFEFTYGIMFPPEDYYRLHSIEDNATHKFPTITTTHSPVMPKTSSTPTNAQNDAVDSPDTDATSAQGGFMSSAHDFVINNSPMTIINNINSGETLSQLLAQKMIHGAEVDSSARDPPPKCHPNTRQALTSRLQSWVLGPARRSRMLWILGPAGIGKSAVSQTVAEHFKESNRLGASLFFSKLKHKDDPDRVIPTLAYQLAIKNAQYKHIVTHRLTEDSTILEKNRRTQFKELIIEPFQILMTQRPSIVPEPLLIILDGLDECKNKEAQREFIRLISDHVRLVEQFPLLWMICSRPESHFKSLLAQPDFQVICERVYLRIDDKEAQKDVEFFLRASFTDIRQTYSASLEDDWPPEPHLERIITVTSGLFVLASTIIMFIGDVEYGDPDGRLEDCIRFFSGYHWSSFHPLGALDILYGQIISEIPQNDLPTVLRIIAFSHFPVPARLLASFLCIRRASFYRSLQALHSVLHVPTLAQANIQPLYAFHPSFIEFLLDPRRSNISYFTPESLNSDLALYGLRWLKHESQEVHDASLPEFDWCRSSLERKNTIQFLKPRISYLTWLAFSCVPVDSERNSDFVIALETFDFNTLPQVPEPLGLRPFLLSLVRLGDRASHLIRILAGPTARIVQHDPKALFSVRQDEDPRVYATLFHPTLNFPQNQFGGYDLTLKLGKGTRSRHILLSIIPGGRRYGDHPEYDILPRKIDFFNRARDLFLDVHSFAGPNVEVFIGKFEPQNPLSSFPIDTELSRTLGVNLGLLLPPLTLDSILLPSFRTEPLRTSLLQASPLRFLVPPASARETFPLTLSPAHLPDPDLLPLTLGSTHLPAPDLPPPTFENPHQAAKLSD